ncbi:MAG: hypothetical protein P8Y36_13045, partial [Alphaproteobacteria bacterium]
MKRATDGTTRGGIWRFALPLIGGVMALSLAGCSADNTAFDLGLTDSSSSEQTVQAQTQQQTKPIAFAPVIGAPSKISSKLNKMLKEQAQEKSVPVVSTAKADYTIRGYLVAQANPKGTKLSYIWDVSDKSGKRAKRFQGDDLIAGKKGGNPWSAVNDEAIKNLAAKTIDNLLTWLPKGSAAPAVAGNSQSDKTTNARTARSSGTPKRNATSAEPAASRSRRPVRHTNSVLASAQPAKVVAVVPPVTG